jgi:hypothetical protein
MLLYSQHECYIQIYTIDKDIINEKGLETLTEYNILITPNEEYIKTKMNHNNLISQIKNINILETFRIQFDKIYNVFKHARNIILKGQIKNNLLTIIGDHQLIILKQELPTSIEVDMVNITLKARNDFLEKYGLPLF